MKLAVVMAALGSWLLTPLIIALGSSFELFVIFLTFGVPGLLVGLLISCPLIIMIWRRLYPLTFRLLGNDRSALTVSVVLAGLVGNGATSALIWVIVLTTEWNALNLVIFAILGGTPVALLIAAIAVWRAYEPRHATG